MYAFLVIGCIVVMTILGFLFACYFAHCFLTVVIDTAAGINEVRWPSEFIIDWLGKPIYILWVLLPLLFVASIVLVATGNPLAFCISMVVLLWLVAPVMFLSSLAAKSWVALLYGPFLTRWARHIFAYMIFLIWSGVLTALGSALLAYSVFRFEGVVLAAVFLPAVFLLYFRVLGRYAWYVTTRRQRKTRKKQANPLKGGKVEVLDPWGAPAEEPTETLTHKVIDAARDVSTDITELIEAPAKHRAAAEEIPLEEDEWTPNKKPYGVMTESQSHASYTSRATTRAVDDEGYAIEELKIDAPVSLFQFYEDRQKKEDELREKGISVRQYERPRKPPKLWPAMSQEIIGFLFFSHTLRAWITLGFAFLIELALLNLVVQITKTIQQS